MLFSVVRRASNWVHAGKFKQLNKKVYDVLYEYTEESPENLKVVKGPDLNKSTDINYILDHYGSMGIQADSLSKGIEEVNKMLEWRLSDEEVKPEDTIRDLEERKKTKCTVFLGYASIVTTSGLRDIIRWLVQHKLVDCLVTTTGGIEEDFIKCLGNVYQGDFQMDGVSMRKKGWNRNGNMIIATDDYIKFQEFALPVLDKMLEEQKQGEVWSPSKLIHRLGREINNEESIYYWAAKNNIPVFCPSITDGNIGDILYMHNTANPGLQVDLVSDIRRIYDFASNSHKTGAVVVGSGLAKHHIMLSNIIAGGLKHAVYINTAQEFDASDGGARPDEGKSWGKINANAQPVKIFGEGTLVFPLLVARTFVPYFEKIKV